jgi:capsule polysaccharide export protein KpsE/RkpR
MRQSDTQVQPETEGTAEYRDHEVGETTGTSSNSWFYVWMVWEKRSFIGRCAMVGAVASLLLAFLLPKEYEATTQLMPPDGDGLSAMSMMASKVSALAENPMIGKFASEALGAKTPGALFVGVLQSRTVQDRIINKFDLRRVYWVKYYDSARKKLVKRTVIQEDRKSGIIAIIVTDRDPVRAAAIAQEYVAQLNLLMSQLTTSRAHRERVFLEDRLIVAKQELDAASKDLGEFSSKNATIDLKDEGKAIVDSAAILQGQLIATQSEVKGLEEIYTSSNVRVKALHARIGELERKLNEMGGAKGISVGSAGPSNDAVGEGNDAGEPKNSFLYPSLRQLPILGERYSDLYLRAKIAEKVYELLTSEYEMARVEEAKEIPSVRALDLAVPPERRSWPPRTIVLVSGSLLFAVGGTFWIVGKREWDNLDPADPRKVFAFEVFAVTSQGLASSRVVSYLRRWKPAFLNFRQKVD